MPQSNKKHSIEFVRTYIEDLGYFLISDEYINAATKLKLKCPNNHIFEVTWNNFSGKYGSRCPVCWKERNRGSNHHMYGKGYKIPWYGKKRPKEHSIKLSESLKKAMNRPEVKKKLSKSLKKAMNRPEVKEKFLGENNPSWNGGIQCEPYCQAWFDKEFKRFIKNRDSKTCKNCGLTELMSLKVYSSYLCLHHIDYIKKNCSPENLITLCVSCNAKANFNREFHTEYYQNLVIGGN